MSAQDRDLGDSGRPAPSSGALVRGLVRHGSAYSGALAAQIASQVIVLPILTRALPPAEYGLVALALVVANIAAVVLDGGAAAAISRRYFLGSDGPSESRTLTAGSAFVALILGAIAVATVPLWASSVSARRAATVMGLAVATGAAIAMRNGILAYVRSEQRVSAYVVVSLLSTAGAQVVGTALAWPWLAEGYMAGTLLGVVGANAVGFAVVRPRVHVLRRSELRRWALRFGLPTVPYQLAAVSLWFADRFVIEHFLGVVAAGRYQLGYTVGSITLMVAMALNAALVPTIHSAVRTAHVDALSGLRRQLATHGLLGAAAVGLVAPSVLAVLAPPAYDPVALSSVAVIVAFSVVPLVEHLFDATLIAESGRTPLLAWSGSGAAIANLVGSVILVGSLGLVGVAVSTLLSYVILEAATSWSVRRVFPSAPQLRSAGVHASGLLLIVLLVWMPTRGPFLIIRVVAAAALSAALAVAVWRTARR